MGVCIMDNQGKYVASPLEISTSLLAYFIGVAILTFPGPLAVTLDTADGWLTLIIAGLVTMVPIVLYVHMQKHFPGKTLLQYLKQGALGKWWAFIFAVLFFVYFVTLLGWEARMLNIVLDMYLLDRTPATAIVASILIVTSYAVTKGLPGIVHMNLIFVPIILIVLLFVFLLNIDQVELDALRPIAPKGIGHVLKAFPDVLLGLVGSEILMFFVAHMKTDQLRAWPMNIAVAVATLSYILVTIFTYFVFSVDEAKVIPFTTIELAKAIEFPGGFFEHIESLMITIWTLSLFTTMIICQLLAIHIIKDQFYSQPDSMNPHPKEGKWLTAIIVFVAFIVAFIPESITEALQLGDWIGILALFLWITGLLIGYITILWRKRETGKVKEQRTL